MTLLIEFSSASDLRQALPVLVERHFEPIEAYTPHAVDGLADALGHAPSRIRYVMLAAAIVGLVAAFGLQAWSAMVDYPLNVGGRPTLSWPAFVPSTFEVMILLAAVGGFVALLVACRLPRLHHELFATAAFARASEDRFFLAVRDTDAAMSAASRRETLRLVGALAVHEIAP